MTNIMNMTNKIIKLIIKNIQNNFIIEFFEEKIEFY